MKLVRVIWEDITSSSGWHLNGQLDTFITTNGTVHQVGYLYEYDDPDYIVLLDSYFPNGSAWGAPTKIPRGTIKSIEELVIAPIKVKKKK